MVTSLSSQGDVSPAAGYGRSCIDLLVSRATFSRAAAGLLAHVQTETLIVDRRQLGWLRSFG
jgi:hypothetical protein